MSKRALIIGAGPAGLTAGLELLKKTDIIPLILERTDDIGGISKTVVYKSNRIDIGGHRFFSKSSIIMNYWLDLFPLLESPENISKNEKWETSNDNVFLKRKRLSRILYLSKFFDYPITLNFNTLKKLGFLRIVKIGFSYIYYRVFPIKEEKSLEDFFINRFGNELYKTFFKDYTEKVWGKSCKELSAEWGSQRIKGLSIKEVIKHYIKSLFNIGDKDIAQKDKETSLIDWFLYPKFGPGQLWEHVADIITKKGGNIVLNANFIDLKILENQKFEISYCLNGKDYFTISDIDYVFSTTSIKNLIKSMHNVPLEVDNIAQQLEHRNFITVGVLLNKLKIKNKTKISTLNDLIPDNWIYVQEKDVKMGRIQIFNNWSPFMLEDENKVWLGLEYFCNETDDMWQSSDNDFITMAIEELVKIKFIDKEDVIDTTILRVPDTYPVYHGAYYQLDIVKDYLNNIKNLYLIGRSGMHRYNNSDHSMLSAIVAVQSIIDASISKEAIWQVNTEEDYHESK